MIDDAATLTTSDGVDLEAAWSTPETARAHVVVTHPHPLMGGDMHNPVPATIASVLTEAGIGVLRFNFRGAGASQGRHDDGRSEQLDVRAAVDALRERAGGSPVFGVGYSFGADVLLATTDLRLAGVVVIAPPLRVLPVADLLASRGAAPTLVLSPEHDQFCDAAQATATTSSWPDTIVETVTGADHFLHAATDRVAARVLAFIDGAG